MPFWDHQLAIVLVSIFYIQDASNFCTFPCSMKVPKDERKAIIPSTPIDLGRDESSLRILLQTSFPPRFGPFPVVFSASSTILSGEEIKMFGRSVPNRLSSTYSQPKIHQDALSLNLAKL